MPTSKQTALITGATSGFGRYVALHLLQRNYKLVVFARSSKKQDDLKKWLSAQLTNPEISFIDCDLTSFDSVLKACHIVIDTHQSLDVLICNAGIWNFKQRETIDGIEETLQVNVLAPLLIFQKLFPIIPKHKASKVIFTASALHFGKVNFPDLEYRRKYSGFHTYRQSKLGIVLITKFLANQKEYEPISFFAVHPGVISTELARDGNSIAKWFFRTFGQSEEKGARTHQFLIEQNTDRLTSGAYYANSKIKQTTKYSCNIENAEKFFHALENFISQIIK